MGYVNKALRPLKWICAQLLCLDHVKDTPERCKEAKVCKQSVQLLVHHLRQLPFSGEGGAGLIEESQAVQGDPAPQSGHCHGRGRVQGTTNPAASPCTETLQLTPLVQIHEAAHSFTKVFYGKHPKNTGTPCSTDLGEHGTSLDHLSCPAGHQQSATMCCRHLVLGQPRGQIPGSLRSGAGHARRHLHRLGHNTAEVEHPSPNMVHALISYLALTAAGSGPADLCSPAGMAAVTSHGAMRDHSAPSP